MKGIKTVFLFLLCALMLVPTLVLAQGAVEETGESYMRLAWWGNPTRDERTIKVVNMYMEQHPNVKIETETTGWAGYWDKMNTQAAAGSLPDLMQHDYAYMLQWVGRNQLLDLTGYVDSGVIKLDKVAESALAGGRVNGKLYGINLGSNAVCLVYDPAVLATCGIAEPDSTTWTWADFEKIATEVYKKTGVQTIPFFTTDPKVGFDNMVRQTGASTYAKTGKGLGFADPTVLKEFFAIQLRLLKSGVLINPENAFVTVTPEEGDLAKGRTWVEFIWSNQLASTQSAAKRPLKMALLPKIANAKQPGTFLKPSMFFSIPATAENPKEAARFLNFFLNDIAANDILLGDRGVPVPSDVRAHMTEGASDINKTIFNFISLAANNSSAIDPPDPTNSGEFLKMFRDATQEILLGKISLDDGAVKIMAKGNEILKK